MLDTNASIQQGVVWSQETCWKPYLSGRSRTQNDDGDGDDEACSYEDEMQAAIHDCLLQYQQHYIKVSVAFLL